MKKIFILLFMLILLVSGCGKYGEDNVVKDFSKKINKLSSYKVDGDLEIVNNDEVYNYDIVVSYKKSNNYRVEITNKANNHTQIILKNSDGVYV